MQNEVIFRMLNNFADCVKKARGGDANAFAQLYSLVYKDMYRIALFNLNNEHDASDVVSDTVLDAFKSIKNLRDENAFKSWIMKILTAKINNKQREYTEIRNDRENLDDIIGTEKEKADEMDFSSSELADCFGKLDKDERLVLSLGIVSGYRSDEIAAMTGMNSNTVRSKAARAKIKLKKLMSGEKL